MQRSTATGGRPIDGGVDVSVVIPVLDGMPWLEDQLAAVADQGVPPTWEVVVADNGSTDGTRRAVQAWTARDPRVRLVDAPARRGPGPARNAGAAAATGRLLAFCDADDVVRPGWLAACTAALDGADLVAGTFDFASLNGAAAAAPVPAATVQLGFLPAGLGANLGVRRQAFEAVGGFDETLEVGEDIDLCWRLQLAGFRFAPAPGAVVAKREPPDARRVLRTAWAYGRCGPRLYRRHRSAGMHRDLRGAAKAWTWLLVAWPANLDRRRRRRWARTFGVRSGRLAGSVRQRVFFP